MKKKEKKKTEEQKKQEKNINESEMPPDDEVIAITGRAITSDEYVKQLRSILGPPKQIH